MFIYLALELILVKKRKELQNCFVNNVTNRSINCRCFSMYFEKAQVCLSVLEFYFLKPYMYKSFLLISVIYQYSKVRAKCSI